MAGEITINGGLRTDALYVTLPDGRELTLTPTGHLHVSDPQPGEGGAYSLALPTVAAIADLCRETANTSDDDNAVQITVHHQH